VLLFVGVAYTVTTHSITKAVNMKPHMEAVDVTTIQELLRCNKHNVKELAEKLKGANRTTINLMLKDNRKHHVIMNGDYTYTLLK